jgi:hypothetical protein
MDWKGKLDGIRGSGKTLFDERSKAVLEEHWPKAQKLFQEKIGPAALKAAQNDQQMAEAFRVVYKLMPFPVHLAVNEEVFVQFCLVHRADLLPLGDETGASKA